MGSTSTTDIVVTQGDVVSIELNRPETLNALRPTTIEQLHDAFSDLADDPPWGVLLTGRGRATCAGMDVEVVSQDYETDFADVDALAQELYALVEALPCPVAVGAREALVGMGFVLSLSCEFLVVEPGTMLSVPEVSFDIASERAATRLPDLVGPRPAAKLLLTGEPIGVDRAHELGLVTEIADSDDAETRARALLDTVAEHDRETVAELCGLLGGERDGR